MHVDKSSEVEAVLEVVWVDNAEKEELVQYVPYRRLFFAW
jgi:hypothetical protein